MKKFGFILLFLAFTLGAYSQSQQDGEQLFNNGQYEEAADVYRALLKRSPSSQLYLYRYARCAYEMGQDSLSIVYFLKAGDKYSLTYYYLGELYLRAWRLDEAEANYQRYLSSMKTPNERVPHIQQQMARIGTMRRYLKRVQQLQVIDYEELRTEAFLEAYQLSPESGRLQMDAGGLVTYTSQGGERELYTVADGAGKRLLTRERLLDSWTPADTLAGNVNFTHEQNYPFCLSDGVTIYYAAKDSNGLGGWDIYMARFNTATNQFTQPENLGFPFNSEKNDYMLALDEVQQVGYFATDRFSAPGFVRVYRFRWDGMRSYVKDMSEDSLVAYARLKAYVRAESIMHEEQSKKTVTDIREEISFVLNNTVTYTTWAEFRSAEAAKKYEKYLADMAQLEAVERELVVLREDYARSDEAHRKQLTPAILSYEKTKEQLLTSTEQLLNTIRRVESSARH